MKRRSFFGALSGMLSIPTFLVHGKNEKSYPLNISPKIKENSSVHSIPKDRKFNVSNGKIEFIRDFDFVITTDDGYARMGDMIETNLIGTLYIYDCSVVSTETRTLFYKYKCRSLSSCKIIGRNVIKLAGKWRLCKNVNTDIIFATSSRYYN